MVPPRITELDQTVVIFTAVFFCVMNEKIPAYRMVSRDRTYSDKDFTMKIFPLRGSQILTLGFSIRQRFLVTDVLIELKTTKLTPEAAGQINMYLNYYAAEINDPDDNPPIGIILCTDKDSITAEYALGGLSNNIFASRYILYMPNKDHLIAQVEAVLNKWHNQEKTDEI